MRSARFKYEVVDSIPEKLRAGTLYAAKDGDVAGHLCACGCGREVITPLSSTDWSVKIGQRGATLDPSVGNWAFPCRSHYFIWDGDVVWARNMSNDAVAQGRQRNKARKLSYYRKLNETVQIPQEHPREHAMRQTRFQKLIAWWQQLFAR